MVASEVSVGSRVPTMMNRSDGDEASEVLQSVNLNEDNRGVSTADSAQTTSTTVTVKRSRTREVASRYKAATVSSATAAAITAQRYQSPTNSRGRSPSPNFGRTRTEVIPVPVKSTLPLDRRPASAERRRPWPTASLENKTPGLNDPVRASISSLKRLTGSRADASLWPSAASTQSSDVPNPLSNDIQSDQPDQNGVSNNSEQGETVIQSVNHVENGRVLEPMKVPQPGKSSPQKRRIPLRRPINTSEQSENARPIGENQSSKFDSHRWPGVGNAKAFLTRSVDLSSEKDGPLCHTLAKSASKNEKNISNGRALCRLANEGGGPNLVRRMYTDSGEERTSKSDQLDDCSSSAWETEDETGSRNSLMRANSLDDNGSDTESSSSGSLSVASFGTNSRARGTVVPARFWQEATSGTSMRRLKVSSSSRSVTPVRTSHSGHSAPPSPLSPSSHAKSQALSPSRALRSPTRSRTGHPVLTSQLSLNGRRSNVSGMLNLNLDIYKNKKTTGQQEEAHDLRLLHNRWLQWHYVNARTEQAMKSQTATAEGLIYKCFTKTCELRESVSKKRIEKNKITQSLKLDSIIAATAAQLESWESIHSEHATALNGVMEALEATVVRVPLIGGPKVDIQATKEVLASAVEVMDTVDTFVNQFLEKATLADSLLSELAKTTILEKASLAELGDLLTSAASLEAEERSLRAYFVQMEEEKKRLQEKTVPS